jgi:hypothetical protein
MQVGEN